MKDYSRLAERLAAERLAAPGDRWALMREIQRDWGLPDAGAVQTPAAELGAEIAGAERRLGFALPAALKEWYALPSNPTFLKPRLFWTHLRWPEDLEVWPEPPDGGAPDPDALIVFQTEYENCCEWAFRARDAFLPDPPVLFGSTEEGECPAAEWQPQNGALTEHLLHLLLVRLVGAGSKYYASHEALTPDLLARLDRHFPDLGLPPWREYGDGCFLRGGPDVLLLLDSRPPSERVFSALTLGARSLEGLERATALLGIDWEFMEEVREEVGPEETS